ncbi:hypothetical protein D3C79_734140 [compost metagenome]
MGDIQRQAAYRTEIACQAEGSGAVIVAVHRAAVQGGVPGTAAGQGALPEFWGVDVFGAVVAAEAGGIAPDAFAQQVAQ